MGGYFCKMIKKLSKVKTNVTTCFANIHTCEKNSTDNLPLWGQSTIWREYSPGEYNAPALSL